LIDASKLGDAHGWRAMEDSGERVYLGIQSRS